MQGGGEVGRIKIKGGGRGCCLAWSKTDLYFLKHSFSCLSAAQINEVRLVFPSQQVRTGLQGYSNDLIEVNSHKENRKLLTPECSARPKY